MIDGCLKSGSSELWGGIWSVSGSVSEACSGVLVRCGTVVDAFGIDKDLLNTDIISYMIYPPGVRSGVFPIARDLHRCMYTSSVRSDRAD